MKSDHGLIATLCLVATSLTASLQAQNITGTITAIQHSYVSAPSHYAITNLKVNGVTYYNGSGYLFCADKNADSLDDDSSTYPRIAPALTLGTMEDMTVWERYTNTPAQDKPLAMATAHWFIDNYYESAFLNPASDTDARQFAFQKLLWEIFYDAGTSSGVSFTTGHAKSTQDAPGGSSYNATLWSYLSSYLNAINASGVTSAYVPTYDVVVALDSRSTYQDYLLLSANPNLMVIPEPSTALLSALGILALFHRKRA